METQPTMSPYHIRRIILEQSKRAHVGHIGSALCIAEIISVLYGEVLNLPSPDDPNRDRFILSKGHAALALYAALFLKGWLGDDELNTFCGDGSLLAVHPEQGLRGIDFSTGSLGQGMSFAVGAALAAKLQNSSRRTFALVSDAECNEGVLWESLMFAAHHELASLVVLVDVNGQQALGYTKDILSPSPLVERWKAFGWNVSEVDGHDSQALVETINGLDTKTGRPHVLLAHTTFGKGVSYMENQIKWHYWPMSDNEYQIALKDIGASA